MTSICATRRRVSQDPALAAVVTILAALTAALPLDAQRIPTVVPRAGMLITRSVRVQPGIYILPAPDSAPLVTIRGEGVTVDLTGVTLVGNRDRSHPDRFRGTALAIDGGHDITVRGATIRGYKVAAIARGTRALTLEHLDVSHNWKPRLYSAVEQESLVDWLSFHQNERDEWLRYGAGIYLVDVEGGEIRHNRARQGMNGLLLVRSDRLRIWNNDFSFLSGLGIGLYRSSHNSILHNRVDWCVRGYSQGFYRRGQDSAALLMYEQSSYNIVAYNSMTHGGDGLFLWAGQSTMDTGRGGANDNLFFANDFSHAPTNGMEATFSRNRFIGNRVWENTHGLWGGYSWQSEVVGNDFRDNGVAIAIEHGQDNRVAGNTFLGDSTAIQLWWNRLEPSDWGYPRHRDTRSRNWRITGNSFQNHRVALRVNETTGLELAGNRFLSVDSARVQRGDSTGLAMIERGYTDEQARAAWLVEMTRRAVPRLPGARDALLPEGARRGREFIIVDEWGPYDWQSPKLWPLGRRDSIPLRLRVLGPPGRWKVTGRRGVSRLSDSLGSIGDTLVVEPDSAHRNDWRVQLEYRGARTVSPEGVVTEAGRPVRFSYAHFRPLGPWQVTVVAWDSASDPRASAETTLQPPWSAALLQLTADALEWMWYRPAIRGVPQARWAAHAVTEVELPDEPLLLRAISDDGIRIWVDDALVIDHWTAHESAVDEVPIRPGRHRIRVEYYQVDGWTELQVGVVRDRGKGS